MDTSSRSTRLRWALLVLVAVISLAYYAISVSGTLMEVYGDRVPRNPTFHGIRLRMTTGLQSEAAQAGIHTGDRITAINGRPFTGYTVQLEELRRAHAGDLMTMTVQSGPAAAERILPVRLAPIHVARPGVMEQVGRALFLFLNILFPLGCLLLGLWVVAARPADKNAWFLLGTLEYFVLIFAGNQYWPGAGAAFTGLCSALGAATGPLCIMFFGIYFPERSRFDVSFPWVKWVLTAAFSVLVLASMVYTVGFLYSFRSIAWLAPSMGIILRALTVLGMIAFSIYFMCLGEKTGTAASPDVKRRLQILYIGSTVGNAPLFVLVLYSLVTGKDIGFGAPSWLFIGALLIFTLFPLSLAYVVVVHRAMELRILVRQGTKYALARSSLWLIRVFTGYLLVAVAIQFSRHHLSQPVGFAFMAGLAILLLTLRSHTSKTLSLWIDRKFFREAYSAEQVLGDLATQAQMFTEVPPLLRTVSRCISDTLHIDRIAVLLRSGDTFRLQYAVGTESGPEVLISGLSETIANLDMVKRPANVYLDNPDSWLLAATDSERRTLRALGAEMLIPLRGRNRLVGVMALGPKRSEEPYSRSDRGLLQSVALHTGLSIENSELVQSLAVEAARRERIDREIEVAREVQERFLPQSYPAIAGVELAAAYRAAQSVGGDYYDFIEMRAAKSQPATCSSLGIAIGDVSGKGISAALLMASLRASLRSLTRNSDGDFASMMAEVNQLVYEASASNRYATFFFAHLDPATRRLTYVNAGHNAPALLRQQRDSAGRRHVARLETGGPVLGLIEHTSYEQASLVLEPGDILLAFTDGISEAMTAAGEEWSEERLIEQLAGCPELPAAQIVELLVDAADDFAGGAPQHDDMTLLVVKVL